MKVFNKVKGILYAAALTLTLGVSVSAAKIENEPTITYKNAPVSIGTEINIGPEIEREDGKYVHLVANLKINGKSLSKSKKKVKAIHTAHYAQGVYNPKDVTVYIVV